MFQKLKIFFKRIFRKKEVYFTEGRVIDKLISEYSPTCNICGKSIITVDDVYKLIIKRKKIEYFCFQCGEESKS